MKKRNELRELAQNTLQVIFYIAFALGGIWIIKTLIRDILR